MTKLTIEEVIEHEDGSATLTIDIDNEMLQSLLQYAVLDMLTKTVELPPLWPTESVGENK